MRRGTLRLVAALALAAALIGPVAPARAAGSNGRGGPVWSWAGLWSWLAAAVTHQPTLQADCGSQIDPDGRCVAAVVAPPQPLLQVGCDRGSQIDPNGGCVASMAVNPNG